MKNLQPSARWLAIAALAAVAVLAVWLLRGTHQVDAAGAASSAVPVTLASVAKEDLPLYLGAIGTVQAAQSVTVKARVDGQLEKLAFTEGSDVKAGELLAQIDARPYQAQLNQALAQKAHDEAQLTAALKDLERYTTLVAQDSIQKQALDAQTSTVDQLKASLQSDQAQIDNARVQLSYTSIVAPVEGRTGMRLIDVGNIVHASDATGLVVINQIDPIAVVFALPEDNFQSVNQAVQQAAKGGAPLRVQALARESGAVLGEGKLLLINNQIDAGSGTFQLKAQFSNQAHSLWPGQYVNVRLLLGEHHDAATVPESAVQRGPDGLLVYVVKADDTVAAQPIRVAQIQEGKAIVSEGLAPGTRVVVDGQYKIKPGVKVVDAKQAAKTNTQQSGAR